MFQAITREQANGTISSLITALRQALNIEGLSTVTTPVLETRSFSYLHNKNMTHPSKVFPVTEHLKGVSVVGVIANVAVQVERKGLERFGPVSHVEFTTFSEALAYLLPIKSFTTRYLVLGLDEWSLLLTDMRGEFCYVDAYAISRETGCKAIGVIWQEKRRELHVFEEGKKVREIQSLCDGDRWYYRESGDLQPFEDANECIRRQKKDRLQPEALKEYFQTYTNLPIPAWNNVNFTRLVGLERSIKDIRVPVTRFETVNDLNN